MGFKITITGLIVFLFFSWMFFIAKRPPVTVGADLFSCVAVIGFFAIPVGLIVQVWWR